MEPMKSHEGSEMQYKGCKADNGDAPRLQGRFWQEQFQALDVPDASKGKFEFEDGNPRVSMPCAHATLRLDGICPYARSRWLHAMVSHVHAVPTHAVVAHCPLATRLSSLQSDTHKQLLRQLYHDDMSA